jgi:membrane-associated phospholipid phosphatase
MALTARETEKTENRKGFKALLHKYRHIWALIYIPIYFLWFFGLEGIVSRASDVHIIHTPFDDMIPFCEYFIIPYYIWFLFVPLAGFFYFFTNREEFYRFCIFIFSGMTLAMIVCTLWHNGLNLRPDLTLLGRDNMFIHVTGRLYKVDTAQNVCPSIHVINSIGVAVSVINSDRLNKNKAVTYGSIVVAALICLSTMFLKQHSVVDVAAACLLCVPLYFLAYRTKLKNVEPEIN